MAGKSTSFEERLARIENARDGSSAGSYDVKTDATRPQSKLNGTSRIAMIFAAVFVALSAGAFFTLLSSESAVLALAEWTTRAE